MKRKLDFLTAGIFLLALFGCAIAFFLLPDRTFSEQENRSLRSFPKFSWEKLLDGRFGDEINEYYADQFPLRDGLVGIKGVSEILLGKGENDGILLGENGQLAKRLFSIKAADGQSVGVELDCFDAAHIASAAQGINRVAQNAEVPFTVLLTPRTLDVAASAFSYPREQSDALHAAILSGLDESVQAIDLLEQFRERYDAGEAIYFKTDHHWTTLGAYYAYAELLTAWGMGDELLPMSAFTREVVSEEFYGTAWSAGGMKFVAPDSLELWKYGNEDAFCVVADGRELADGFYSYGYLQKKDKYSVFLDGTHDVVTVTKQDGEERPTLLLIKDSFANSIAPFLAQHFDLVLLNLSSTQKDYTNVTELAAQYDADRVLLLYGMENIVTANRANRLE